MRVGKLPERLLARLLARMPKHRSVLLGPAVGEDAAAVRLGKGCLIAAADPVTFAAERIGQYALTVNANDVATRGARPRWFLATLLLPQSATPRSVERIFRDLARAARRAGVTIIGGHTEVTAGLDRPIVSGCMLGELDAAAVVRTSGIRPRDRVLLTKGVPIEAASILAREHGRRLKGRVPPAAISKCLRLADELSVVEEALAAARLGRVHAMHDPTEGGLSTGLYELAAAGKVAIDVHALPVVEEARPLLEALGLDPLGALASGALLIAAPPKDAEKIRRGLLTRGVPTFEIGRARRGRGVWLAPFVGGPHETRRPMKRFQRDEIARLFGGS